MKKSIRNSLLGALFFTLILGSVFNSNAQTWNVPTGTTTTTHFGTTSTHPLKFYTDNTEKMRLTISGALGIGVTTVLAKLHVNDGAILADGTTGSTPTSGAGTRLMWIPEKYAFRAGKVGSTSWDAANVGDGSVAFGQNTTASGTYSFAAGNATTASGIGSVAFGGSTGASGNYSFAQGVNGTGASGAASFAMGTTVGSTGSNSFGQGAFSYANGTNSISMGFHTNAYADYSTVIGYALRSEASGSFILGRGVNATSLLTNNTANSLMIGFNSTVPTFFVGPSSGAGTTGSIGIATSAPHASSKLHVHGAVLIGDATINMPSPFTSGGYGLYVQYGILTEKVKVAVNTTGDWSDYVFANGYKLRSLESVEAFIKENKHLPDVPSAEQVVSNGIDVAKMDATLLQKIEELTLYIIQLNKKIEALEKGSN